MTKLSDYKLAVFRLLPHLQVLDSHNKFGEVAFSDSDDNQDQDSAEEHRPSEQSYEEEGAEEDQLQHMGQLTAKDYLHALHAEAGEDDMSDHYPEEAEPETKRQRVE